MLASGRAIRSMARRATFVNGDVFEGTKDDRGMVRVPPHADGRPIERAIYADGEFVKGLEELES